MSKKKAKKNVKIEGDEVLSAELTIPTVEITSPGEIGEPMNDLAMRIWIGQSVSLPITERVKRIKARLTEKGYDISTLKLPVEDRSLGK